jgi:hypothetical protein
VLGILSGRDGHDGEYRSEDQEEAVEWRHGADSTLLTIQRVWVNETECAEPWSMGGYWNDDD